MIKNKILFPLLLLFFSSSTIFAQGPPPRGVDDFDTPPPENNQNLAKLLDLSKEQKQQIRRINVSRRPQMIEAQEQFRIAKEELDELIYSDNVDEGLLASKLQAVVKAQSDITRIRLRSELAVRNILTQEQLVRFRNLRNKIKEERQKRQKRMLENQRLDRRPPKNQNDIKRPLQNRQGRQRNQP